MSPEEPTEKEQAPGAEEEQAKPAAKAKPAPAKKPAAKKPAAKAAEVDEPTATKDEPVLKEPVAKDELAAKEPVAKQQTEKKSTEKKPAAAKKRDAKAEKASDAEAENAGDAKTEKPVATKTEKPATAGTERAAAPVRRKVVRAQARYVRTSARKARMVCGHLRGKSVPEARAILAFTPREVARDWSKLLESAVANAENNHELIEDDLLVREAYADEGPTIKRFRPRAQGRATPIRKRTSHLTITLTPKP
jgi:ribosomal protein L22